MTSRKLGWVWLAAFALFGGVLVPLSLKAERQSHWFRNFDIAVIGSSLSYHAVPAYGAGRESLLGDGRSHRRIAVPSISEEQSLLLLDRAIHDHVKLVLMEANPFIFQFAGLGDQRRCGQWFRPYLTRLKQYQYDLVDTFRKTIGRPVRVGGVDEPANLSGGQHIDLSKIHLFYPLRFEGPCYPNRFESLVKTAKLNGTRVVLMIPPRSPAGEALLGKQASDEVMSRAKQLARRMGIEVLVPGGQWANNEFVDHAHVNSQGRAHFLVELRQWGQDSR